MVPLTRRGTRENTSLKSVLVHGCHETVRINVLTVVW